MQISERQVGDVTVLDLSGKLTLTDSAGRLKDKVNSLIFQGNKKVILNLGELSYMDSSGLGEIVACHTTVSRGGGVIKLANLGGRIKDLLVMTKLLTVFDCYDTEQEAVSAMAQWGGQDGEPGPRLGGERVAHPPPPRPVDGHPTAPSR